MQGLCMYVDCEIVVVMFQSMNKILWNLSTWLIIKGTNTVSLQLWFILL